MARARPGNAGREQVLRALGSGWKWGPVWELLEIELSRNASGICKCLSFHERLSKLITIQNHKTSCYTPDQFHLSRRFLPFLLHWPIVQCTSFPISACLWVCHVITANQLAIVLPPTHSHLVVTPDSLTTQQPSGCFRPQNHWIMSWGPKHLFFFFWGGTFPYKVKTVPVSKFADWGSAARKRILETVAKHPFKKCCTQNGWLRVETCDSKELGFK